MKILIKNAILLHTDKNKEEIGDLYIEDGHIRGIGKELNLDQNVEIVDGKNKVVVPTLIDMHVHFREPGYEWKETLETGSMAAVAGGFTAVACMPNTNPL